MYNLTVSNGILTPTLAYAQIAFNNLASVDLNTTADPNRNILMSNFTKSLQMNFFNQSA